MSNTTTNNSVNNSGIKNSWSLLDFARSHGRMKIAPFARKNDEGKVVETWKSCVFENPNTKALCFVSFSRKLGELTPVQIKKQLSDLQVVECSNAQGEQMFSLCRKGESSWEDVDLGI